MKAKLIKTGLLSAVLTLCMLLTLVPISAYAADSTVSDETELQSALENADCTEIKLGGNIETTWELEVNRTVTLDLNGYTLSCSSTDVDILWVRSSGNLTVKDSGTDGKIDGQNKNCGVNVNGGTLTLESGSIVNCTDADGDGGAVDVSNTGVTETEVKYGSFTMNGGSIMDCKAGDDGAAVDIGTGCSFIMNGGTISGCRAEDDGGAVFIKSGGAFALNGGTIENCSAGANGGAVNIYRDGRFTMTGGTIKSCKVDLGGLGMAVYGRNDEAVVTMTGGSFEDCGVFPYSFDEFTVTFDSDGGSAVPEQKLRNAPAVKPTDPVKNGYDFAGWYLEEAEYTFDSNVAWNITLKAHWTPNAASTAIPAATIENAKFSYQPGDAPQATAWVAADDADKYEIAYECWQEFENNEPVAAWYSDGANHGSLPTFTAFESGKKYVYSLMLKPKDGYSFSSETVVTVNGQKVAAPFVGGSMYIPAVKTITMPILSAIDVVEVNDVTVSFQNGDKPVFTGKTPDGAHYKFRCEWWELDSKTGLISTEPEWGGGIYENKITAFEAGKTYHYGVYVTAVGYVEDENTTYIFTPDTKLKINGEFVNYQRYEGDTSDGSDGTLWVLTDLTMTPKAGGTTPSQQYTITYTDGVDGEEIFPDQTYTVEAGQPTPAFSGTPTRKGYTFAGWDREIPSTMPAENLTIRATWEKEPAPSSPFIDIAPGAYYEKAVAWAVDNGITNGTTATTFSPDNACNRGQIVVFLWRMAGKPIAKDRNNPFTDVQEGSFCYEAVLWAAEQGITTGKTTTTFCPTENCNRGQIVTFLWRYAGKPAPKNQTRQFTDVAANSFCDQAVMWAVENGITNGKTATTFDPTGKCTRAQAVTFLWRGRELLKK